MKRTLVLASLLLCPACIVVAKESHSERSRSAPDCACEQAATEPRVAEAAIEGKSGVLLSGVATFVERDGGVLVSLSVEDAPPGRHAVHLHEKGDCSSADGKSAGGHFNPDTMPHGSPFAEKHHAGDLGNMEVASDGRGRHTLFLPGLTVRPGSHSVVGRAIVIHADADDLTSQPTGAAGGRIGCGVIR